ncbi:YbhB/YbcL family Raf kinase inhibitor-like protein, partial [Desulfovibrio sulfodismutans]|nr:YbhB/YbcL family Raf kinase inhibitor-like protein [Desulfolutivibrio sulfodismutans]
MKKLLCATVLAVLPMTTLAASVFTLQSQDFSDNALLDKKFAGANKSNPSCTGENISP